MTQQGHDPATAICKRPSDARMNVDFHCAFHRGANSLVARARQRRRRRRHG